MGMENRLSELERMVQSLFDSKCPPSFSVGNMVFEEIEESKIILQSLPLCIHEISLEGKILRMNKAGLEMIDKKRETDVIGEDYMNYVSTQDKERIEKLLNSSIKEGKTHKFTFIASNDKIFSSCFVPLRRNGRICKIIGYTYDATSA